MKKAFKEVIVVNFLVSLTALGWCVNKRVGVQQSCLNGYSMACAETYLNNPGN